MTIDEAIENLKYDFEIDMYIHDISTQLAEWLEELKMYRESSYGELYGMVYNKAIDDFVRFANTMPTVEEEDGEIRPMWLEEMAEKLKAGGENEQSV